MTNSLTIFSAEVIDDLIHFRRNKAISFDVLVKQVLFTGVQALGLCTLLSLVLGAIIIAEGYPLLTSIGQTEWIYKILIFAMVRDLGPFIVCLIILARSGTAICTELGNMRVNREIDALVCMGVAPISYLVTPRVIGMILSLVILMSYFLMTGIFGGFLISNLFQNIPLVEFVTRLMDQLEALDLFMMVLKVVMSGFFISVISSFQGLSVQRAITEVPQRNIKAVGGSVIAVVMVNAIGSGLYMILVNM